MYKPNYSSLLAYLEASAKNWPEREALIIRRRIRREIIKYSELLHAIAQTEFWFQKEKILPRSKILFWGQNCPEYTAALLTSLLTNRVAVPIDWRTGHETIVRIIDKTQPKFCFISKYFKHDFLLNRQIRVFYIEDLFTLFKATKTQDFKSLLTHKNYTDPENIVEIVFTSGTTGKPKGVVMKQKNILANLRAVELALPDLNNSRTISILPLSHMLEQIAGLLLPLGHGTSIYYLPRINSFRLLQTFSEYKPTHLVFVPQMLKIFWNKIESHASTTKQLDKLKRLMNMTQVAPRGVKRLIFRQIHALFGGQLRYVACGGAPLDVKIAKHWVDIGIPIIEGYGATEVTAIATINTLEKLKIGSVGKPLRGVKIHLKKGEIYIQSESVSSGYFADAKRNKASFTQLGYKTGDIGELDGQGYLRIVGRDVFKIVLPSGEKVFVEDLESKISNQDSVKETCVVARRLSDGDQIHAFFILKHKDADLKKIVAQLNSRLESKQQITSFELWPQADFPRTPTLKIDRKLMSELANNHISRKAVVASQLNTGQLFDILDVVSKVSSFPKERIVDTDILATDLELDSLTRTELVSLAEEYLGIVIDEASITSKTTIGDLKDLCKHSENIADLKLPVWQFSKWGQFFNRLVISMVLIPLHNFVIKINYPQIHLPRIKPGSLVLINHPGILDDICTIRLLWKQGLKKITSAAVFTNWEPRDILTFAIELFVGGLPLYKSGQKFTKVMSKFSDLLDQGYAFIFAPQGRVEAFTAMHEDPFLPGVGYIAKELRKPIFIVKVKGYKKIWPNTPQGWSKSPFRELLPKRRGTVEVIVSEEIKVDYENLSPIQITNLLEEKYKAI